MRTTKWYFPRSNFAFTKGNDRTRDCRRKSDEDGKNKVEAAIVMSQKPKGADRETVIAAFMEGADLTEKGSVTYWYNCQRKIVKSAAKS